MKIISSHRLLSVSAILVLTFTVYGQPSLKGVSGKNSMQRFDRPNVLKINTVSLAFSNISLFYERQLYNRWSASLGIGYKYRGAIMKLFSSDNETLQIDLGEVRGFSLSPEFRYYLKTCETDAPAGFYGGLYMRYTKYYSDAFLDYNPINDLRSVINGDFSITEFGYGFQLGYQLSIKKRFIMDFQFFGPRYSFLTFSGDMKADITEDFKQALEDYINVVIERFMDDYNFSFRESSGRQVKAKFRLPNVRFGISIGYTF